MRLGKRDDDKVEEEPLVGMISQKRNPEIILQKRDPDQVDQQDEFGGSRQCLEKKICNVVFNRNGMTYRIFYRHN